MKNRNQYLDNYLLASMNCVTSLQSDQSISNMVIMISEACQNSLEKGGKLFFAGNGGSAADCQHMAGEYVSKFMFDRPALPAIALTTDTSILTAIGNDYGFEDLFLGNYTGSQTKVIFCLCIPRRAIHQIA